MSAKYRCKHVVEAMRWTGDHDNRTAIAEWFASNGGAGARLETCVDRLNSVATLSDEFGSVEVPPGHWLVFTAGEFLVMDEASFAETYEPAAQP